MKTLLLCSGGADSSTLLYKLYREGAKHIRCIFVQYGSKQNDREYRAHLDIVNSLRDPERVSTQKIAIDFNALGIVSSLMKDSSEVVPEGHYDDPIMVSTVVPIRNGIMLCIASAIAESMGFDRVAIAAHLSDRNMYPDCRSEFMEALGQAVKLGTNRHIEIIAPFTGIPKTGVVALGRTLGVPYELTYSCYKGREKHCGKCGACSERVEAFGEPDPTLYE